MLVWALDHYSEPNASKKVAMNLASSKGGFRLDLAQILLKTYCFSSMFGGWMNSPNRINVVNICNCESFEFYNLALLAWLQRCMPCLYKNYWHPCLLHGSLSSSFEIT
ncbi:hypothetical protein M5K25_026079 [Dendrobium thyrsiflorum]|uniref:Uncharacterized protein n=1 Tax=Dendrobium thyrsiflorum TaxID=117978 RepID=A0ABD0TWC1_DENTH